MKIKRFNENFDNDIDVLEIRIDGTYFGDVTKDDENYYTHGQLGENTFENCEELFKYLTDFGGISFENIFWK